MVARSVSSGGRQAESRWQFVARSSSIYGCGRGFGALSIEDYVADSVLKVSSLPCSMWIYMVKVWCCGYKEF